MGSTRNSDVGKACCGRGRKNARGTGGCKQPYKGKDPQKIINKITPEIKAG
jgi:hypothetical protein